MSNLNEALLFYTVRSYNILSLSNSPLSFVNFVSVHGEEWMGENNLQRNHLQDVLKDKR